LTRRAAAAAVFIALGVMGGCALPRTTLQDREAFLAKVNVRIRPLTEESADSVDAFAGVIADAAGMAIDVGEDQAFAADRLGAQRVVDERRAEIAQDLAALHIIRRFHAFFETSIPADALQKDIADRLRRTPSQ